MSASTAIAMLMANTVIAAYRSKGIEPPRF